MTTKYNFEAETWRILELLTHSIYSNKEIFLRELVSNCSDAIDKARLKSLTDQTFLGDDTEFKITVTSDKNKGTITIEDNGIGMTWEELHSHLGTIAKSGTKEFVDKLQKAKEDWEHNMIGQFWVGFYSCFMIADKVEVETKSALDKKAHKWISDGKSSYEVSEIEKENRGTVITLFVNEANKELVEEWKIKELIKKYSNYVGVPIMMKEYDSRTEEEKKKEPKEMWFEQINETKPIWKKDKKDIKKEDYKAFYNTVSNDYNDQLLTIHNNVEWMVSYKSILFAPREQNMYQDLSNPNIEYGPKLYVQNVLILENAKELLPAWLRFVSWVVETTDLPLNISREMLQSNQVLEKIKKWLTKKVITELGKTMKKDLDSYEKFWDNYGKILKEWIYYDPDLKEDVAWVCKFKSMLEGKNISLEEYLEKAPIKKVEVEKNCEDWIKCCSWTNECTWENKKEEKCCETDPSKKMEIKEEKTIYYIIGKTESEALASPYLAQFKEKNVDVLIMTDPIDSFLFPGFSEYKEVKLVSAVSSDVKLWEETKKEKEEKEKKNKDFKSLLDLVKNTIWEEKIETVELNEKLWDSLWALKTATGWVDPQMEKMMKAMWQNVPAQKRILELNPNSPLVESMKKEFESDIKSAKLADTINYAYYQAILLEWWELENPAEFIRLTNKFANWYLA